jgi:Flp pilus assembly protein CpaB
LYLITALLLALLAGVLTYFYLDQIRANSVPTARAVVAAVEIRPGTVITSGMIDARAVPRNAMPDEAMRDSDQVIGRLTYDLLVPGQVIHQRNLIGEGSGLASRLPDGRWAVVIPVSWLASPLPDVKRGDVIDILAYPAGQPIGQAALILEQVELLDSPGSQSAGNVTLIVSLEQATSIFYSHVNGFQLLGLLRASGG